MTGLKILKQFCHTDEDGFTYIEVITAIFIISISSFVIWSGFQGAMRAVDKILLTSRIDNELILLEYEFRKAVGSINTDYWKKEINSENLDISQEDELLILKIGQQFHYYNYLSLIDFAKAETGAELIVSDENNREITLKANWGSFILDGKDL